MSGPHDKRPVPLPPRDRDPLGYGRRQPHIYDTPSTGPAQPTHEPPITHPHPHDPHGQQPHPHGDQRADTYYHPDDTPPTQTRAPRTEPPRRPKDDPPGELHIEPPAARDAGGSDSPIVPAGSVTGRSLTLVIAIMCFFASLTAGAVYLMNQSAAAWLRNVASEVTVQVEPRTGSDIEETLVLVKRFLDVQQGIVGTRILSLSDSRALLEPWLGAASALEDLPVPRLISVQLDRSTQPDIETLRTELKRLFAKDSVALDDHRHWQSQIKAVTTSFALGGLAILLLVGAATTAIIISATRSAMLSNREIVEVLHFIGATDRFIAREFSKHFLSLGVRAGLVGAAFAVLVFIAMPIVMQTFGGATVTGAELRRLIGTGSLDLPGYLLIGIVVIVIAALCMLTSRFGVYRILNTQN